MYAHGMRQYLTLKISAFILLSFLAVMSATACRVHAIEQSMHQNTFEKFLSALTMETWNAFVSDVRAGRYGSSDALFSQVLVYHEARESRDFPNSMALIDITPDEFVSRQVSRTKMALNFIRQAQSSDLWRLLTAMAAQSFDDGLAWSAYEIAARLSPAKFEEIVVVTTKSSPANAAIVEDVRQRWLH